MAYIEENEEETQNVKNMEENEEDCKNMETNGR